MISKRSVTLGLAALVACIGSATGTPAVANDSTVRTEAVSTVVAASPEVVVAMAPNVTSPTMVVAASPVVATPVVMASPATVALVAPEPVINGGRCEGWYNFAAAACDSVGD